MTRAGIPHFGRPFSTELSENQVRSLLQAQGNFQSVTAEWPLLVQNTGTGGLRLRIDPSAFDRPAVVATAEPGIQIQQFRIVSVSGSDAMRTRALPGGVLDLDLPITWVARPWFLRGGNTWSPTARNNVKRQGITYSAFTANDQKRVAVKTGTPTISEDQTIVPLYVAKDIIVAAKVNTGVVVPGTEEDDEPVPVLWLDLNTTGRMWAKQL